VVYDHIKCADIVEVIVLRAAQNLALEQRAFYRIAGLGVRVVHDPLSPLAFRTTDERAHHKTREGG
jgi:hypothetical protein